MKHQASVALVFALSVPFLAVGSPAPARAAEELQFPTASPPAFVREQIGLTTVEIEYSRPGVKGRRVFGGLVPYGQIWRTGANAATKLSFDTDITFHGEPVGAGTYGLFTIPGEKEWTVILNKGADQWGSYAYEEANDVVRVTVPAEALGEKVETMSIGLRDVHGDSATLAIAWENTRVPVRVQTNLVEALVPQIEAAMQADGQKPYFAAAMFYYEHDVDLAQAIEWMDMALEENPDAVWMVYRRGLILAKLGEKEAAIDAAKHAIELAGQAGGELGAEYQRLSEALIARVQG